MSINKSMQRGDTIVEVLISMAVVGIVLAGAFGSANRSLRGSQQAQERTEAVKYSESQMELLKSVAVSSPSAVFSQVDAFCLKDDGTVVANANYKT